MSVNWKRLIVKYYLHIMLLLFAMAILKSAVLVEVCPKVVECDTKFLSYLLPSANSKSLSVSKAPQTALQSHKTHDRDQADPLMRIQQTQKR